MNRCCYCNRHFSKRVVKSREHIIPRSMGGTNDKINLIEACVDCNQIRQNMSFKEFSDMIKNKLENNKVVKIRSFTRPDLQNILHNLESQFV